jgi:hypothetical protein
MRDKRGQILWAPTGRFYFHSTWSSPSSVIETLDKEAETAGANWPPLQAGLFEGSKERLKEVTTAYQAEILAKLQWHW